MRGREQAGTRPVLVLSIYRRYQPITFGCNCSCRYERNKY
ncbi:hypothetical protein [Nostoc commune]|nr:hypothetical protein [Nostoc commune]